MHHRTGYHWMVGWFYLLAVSGLLGGPPEEKAIRLRNEIIRTLPQTGGPGKGAGRHPSLRPGTPLSGLYLLQFETHYVPAWEAVLREKGVSMLRYVPEDAFVVRLRQSRPEEVLTLPFVRWLEPYRPDHKTDRRLRRQAVKPEENVAVSVVLAPDSGPAEVAGTRRAFGRIEQEHVGRYGTVLRGSITAGRLEALSKSDSILWIEPLGRMKLNDEVSSKIVAGDGGGHQTLTQSLGFDGAGVTVAVADSGLHNGNAESMHPDLFGRVDAFFSYGGLTSAADEHSHGTHVTGIVAGNGAVGETDDDGALYGLGVAPGAHVVAQRIFDGDGGYHPPNSFGEMTRDALQAGADIGSNSWGDDVDGQYTTFAAEFDELVRDADPTMDGDQPYVLEFSAGNAGPVPGSIGTPAVAKNVIATGASQNDRMGLLIYADGPEAMADFSSRGPAEDGRIKPDIVAPGTWIASLQSASATAENAWEGISQYYQYQGGTSQAGPQVSGAAAVFVQYYRTLHGNQTPSPALVKAALINSAVDMLDDDGTDPVPNHDEGWGRVDLTQIIGTERDVDYVDQSTLLQAGQAYEQEIVIDNTHAPLKITLAYTDVPGFSGSVQALVNDLNLEVEAPDGRVYRGNRFEGGESVPGADAFDSINNVEGVHFLAPQPGIYRVRVTADNVVQDARRDTPELDQDFALVVSGKFLPPGVSMVYFDGAFYTAPDRIHVAVLDFNAAAAGSVNVVVRSDTESSGETLNLKATGRPGVFTNSISTVTGSGTPDSQLQVSHQDQIEAVYSDLLFGGDRIDTAEIDLVPPLITSVNAVDQFGRARIEWDTDERADSSVYYGTDPSLGDVKVGRGFVREHQILLENLLSGQTYYFLVVSTDRAGNVATNDNQGALYSFVAPFAPDVLIVDAFFGDFIFEPPPPIENYTDPFDDLGISYAVWDVALEGSPALVDLEPYRAVFWRLPEAAFPELSSRPTFTPSEQSAVTQYLQGGGSLLVASMEVCSRLDAIEATDFRENVLHVASYEADPGVEDAQGIPGDVIADGLSIVLDLYTDYGGLNSSDVIVPGPNAEGIFYDSYLGGMTGLRYPSSGVGSAGRVVYLAFPLDAISTLELPPNDRTSVLERILDFLAPGLSGEAVLSLDRHAYKVPSPVTVEVADSDLAGTGDLAVTMFSTTESEGQTLMLEETTRRGVFRGSIFLMTNTVPPAVGQLRVQENDLVWAEYADADAGQFLTASAVVETVPPEIDGVSHQEGYIDAVVRWTTTEAADSMVQFSESKAFLDNRTSFDASLNLDHEVRLTGLSPDRNYYYRVLSRDEAGNVKIKDNGGAFYSFRTLEPLIPPWNDTLEGGQTAWVVDDDDGTESSWTLGVPANGVASEAHSPVNAWGSNMDGGVITYSGTQLVSPAIDLTDATQASLRFWHNIQIKDLTFDIAETAAVLVRTNRFSDAAILQVVENSTVGWEEVTLDLTPYAGRVIFLVWNYGLFSFELAGRSGWLVDDISIEAVLRSGGTLVVSNNLAQGNWTLTGPMLQSGHGLSTTLPEMPEGDYTIIYGNVPYYEAPSSQTKTLTRGATLMFLGDYSFTDLNFNGISDVWEQENFGEVSPDRTTVTDTDGDGLTDGSEFAAGTDPKLAASTLELSIPDLEPGGAFSLQWSSVPGRIYRLSRSQDGVLWLPGSDWMEATGSTMSLELGSPLSGGANLFRLEVHP